MLYREIMAVCSQIHTKHINTLCGQNVGLLMLQDKLAIYFCVPWTGQPAVKLSKPSRSHAQCHCSACTSCMYSILSLPPVSGFLLLKLTNSVPLSLPTPCPAQWWHLETTCEMGWELKGGGKEHLVQIMATKWGRQREGLGGGCKDYRAEFSRQNVMLGERRDTVQLLVA